ncbi:MAG: hypothetical protein KA533_01775 [Sphingobium sp.]|nr:hypothetical protein [Sphingobium sp.]MBP6111811.1 hypothetical protein [Sphingobium sp.]MBP8669909.1 hypothetical protein [Sphingobium sp.]MBP9157841.1 hypothetical protein [Sphingobium sp.]
MKHRERSGWMPDEAPHSKADDQATVVVDMQAEEPGFTALLQRVIDDGRVYADTEMARQKLRASMLGAAGRDAALMILAALFLLFGALTALLVACVWMLAPVVGVLGALAITILSALLMVMLLLLVARGRVRRAVRIAFGSAPTQEDSL